jgi:hypothetical protein
VRQVRPPILLSQCWQLSRLRNLWRRLLRKVAFALIAREAPMSRGQSSFYSTCLRNLSFQII